jgi:ribosomal protein S18 acetylase RimI-like enzyme
MPGHPVSDFSLPIAGKLSLLPKVSNILSEAVIRPARPGDSEAIAALMRAGVNGAVRWITVIGSPHLARYIADEVVANREDEYVVGLAQGRVIGMSSWRHTGTTLQLNHLYLASEVRGQGLGTALILDGLRRIRLPQEQQLSVDVFYDNPRARAWYRSWGMSSEHHVRWIQLPLPPFEPQGTLSCTVSGLAESNERYLRYGFSQFTLSTASATYQIGRLGHGLFRTSAGAILHDSAALQGLTQIDPQRQLLCVGSVDDDIRLLPGAARPIAESERLVSSCATVMEHLESLLSRRRPIPQASPVKL